MALKHDKLILIMMLIQTILNASLIEEHFMENMLAATHDHTSSKIFNVPNSLNLPNYDFYQLCY